MIKLAPKDFILESSNSLVIDMRIPDVFERAFLPNSLNIGTNGDFVSWLNNLVQKDRRLLLILPEDKAEEVYTRLISEGFANIVGVLDGKMEELLALSKNRGMIVSITPEEMIMDLGFLKEHEHILDVRSADEFKEGALPGAIHVPLQELVAASDNNTLIKDHLYYVYCGGGYRSVIAASLLQMQGFLKIKNIYGGYTRLAIELQKNK